MKRLAIRIVGFALLLGPSVLRAADLVPFVIEWPTEVHSPADVSFLLHSPAGKDGFVRVENGHLMSGEKHLRLWSVTLSPAFQLLGDSDRNYDMSGYPHAETLADFDVVGGEACWQRPRDLRDASGKPAGWEFPNTPMVADPLASTAVQLARTPVRDKSFVVTAFSHPFPNDFACEGLPILAAYASFQDWDGVFAYNFAHG
jgi:hypothetical protein